MGLFIIIIYLSMFSHYFVSPSFSFVSICDNLAGSLGLLFSIALPFSISFFLSHLATQKTAVRDLSLCSSICSLFCPSRVPGVFCCSCFFSRWCIGPFCFYHTVLVTSHYNIVKDTLQLISCKGYRVLFSTTARSKAWVTCRRRALLVVGNH